MARFIKKIRARYEPLTMDDNRQVTEQEMLRAHEIIDKSLSDSAEDLYILKVHDEACDIINNNGVLFDDSYGELSEERARDIGLQEVALLVQTAAVLVAQQETDRGKPFADEQLVECMGAIMKEVYKSRMELQRNESNAAAFIR